LWVTEVADMATDLDLHAEVGGAALVSLKRSQSDL
jgi:hypothetical protein